MHRLGSNYKKTVFVRVWPSLLLLGFIHCVGDRWNATNNVFC